MNNSDRKAVVEVNRRAWGTVNFPEGTIVEALNFEFDTDNLLIRVSHKSLPTVVEGCRLQRVKLINCSDGRRWFE